MDEKERKMSRAYSLPLVGKEQGRCFNANEKSM